MTLKPSTRNATLLFFLILLAGLFLMPRPGSDDTGEILPLPTAKVTSTVKTVTTPVPTATPGYGDLWNMLLEATPFAYTTPLPDQVENPVDGLYSKIDQSPPQWWRCYRCADYRPAGGIWRLQFDRGVMRIYYAVTGWRTIASYTVADERLYIYNDPFCLDTGEYIWHLEGGQLDLQAVNDGCAFDLRAENLSKESWSVCPSANDVSTTDASPACLENIPIPTAVARSSSALTVNVYGGDSRFFETPPDVAVIANSADRLPPEGIDVSYHPQAVSYGVHRVLWWNGNWIEASTDLPFSSIGVQFYGEAQIGWARVLFDGVEVWRGDTAALSEKVGRHGGYIEISGFEPGSHIIRAESLDFDYRPVTIAGFGFSLYEGVQP